MAERELRCPPVDPRLVAYVREVWPRAEVVPGRTPDSIMYDAGQQSIIDWLEQISQEQHEEDL